MKKAETYEGWEKTFEKAGISEVHIQEHSFSNGGFLDILKDEGLVNTIKVFGKYFTRGEVRRRMNLIDATFKQYPDYFGYGIYSFRK